MIHLRFPDIRDPPEAIAPETFVKVDAFGMHNLLLSQFESPALIGFDGSDAAAAVELADAMS